MLASALDVKGFGIANPGAQLNSNACTAVALTDSMSAQLRMCNLQYVLTGEIQCCQLQKCSKFPKPQTPAPRTSARSNVTTLATLGFSYSLAGPNCEPTQQAPKSAPEGGSGLVSSSQSQKLISIS